MATKTATRQRILEAVITCIEKYGLEQVTTRRIAAEAGANIAAINYHFRSKDDLIAETLSLTINHMLADVMLAVADSRRPFDVTLRQVFRYLIQGSWRFPGISKAHLSQAVLSGRRDTAGARAMLKVFNGLVDRAARAYPRRPRAVLRLRLAQVMNSILFVVLTPDFFGVLPRGRQSRARQAEQYADSLAAMFLRGL